MKSLRIISTMIIFYVYRTRNFELGCFFVRSSIVKVVMEKRVMRHVRIILCFSLFFLIHNVFPQTTDILLSSRFSGDFIIPTSEVMGGFDMYPFQFDENVDSLRMIIIPHTIRKLDTIHVFFSMKVWNISDVIWSLDSSNYLLTSSSPISWSIDSLFSHTGFTITIYPENYPHPDTLDFSFYNINWSPEQLVDICFDSNIPTGTIGWYPLEVGNTWQYVCNTNTGLAYRGKNIEVVNNFSLNDTMFFVIKNDEYRDSIWTNIGFDTVFIDESNNICDKQNRLYWEDPTDIKGFWGGGPHLVSGSGYLNHTITYLADYCDSFPGVDGYLEYEFGIGLLELYLGDSGDPPWGTWEYTYLTGAIIHGVRYGTVTSIDIAAKKTKFRTPDL